MIVYVVTEASVLHLEGYITSLKFNGAKGSDQGYPRVFWLHHVSVVVSVDHELAGYFPPLLCLLISDVSVILPPT